MVGKERFTKEEIKQRELDRKELNNAKKWLSISKEDLESSEILFKLKKYPNSVREFQQSIEKTTKALALIGKSLRSIELKKIIGHNPLETYYGSGILKNLEKVQNLEKAFEKIPELKEIPMMRNLDLKDFKEKSKHAQQIIHLVTKHKLIFSDNLTDLDNIIKDAENSLDEIEKLKLKKFRKQDYDLVEKAWTENIKSFAKLSREKGNPISEEEEKQALSISGEMIEHLAERIYKNTILESITNALNATLNLIIAPHFDFLRYPDKKNPLDYYTEKNPLIKRLGKLIDIQKKNILLHEEYLEFIKGLTSEVVVENK